MEIAGRGRVPETRAAELWGADGLQETGLEMEAVTAMKRLLPSTAGLYFAGDRCRQEEKRRSTISHKTFVTY